MDKCEEFAIALFIYLSIVTFEMLEYVIPRWYVDYRKSFGYC
jgi:hypothetical protein